MHTVLLTFFLLPCIIQEDQAQPSIAGQRVEPSIAGQKVEPSIAGQKAPVAKRQSKPVIDGANRRR